MTEKSTFWNDRVRRIEPIREGLPLRWIFGPCKASSDPKQKWCEDCYGVVAEEGSRRWCRACKASETIANPPQQAVVDELVQAVREPLRSWRRHQEHISCSECKGGGLPTLEQRLATALEEWLDGRLVVESPAAEDASGGAR